MNKHIVKQTYRGCSPQPGFFGVEIQNPFGPSQRQVGSRDDKGVLKMAEAEEGRRDDEGVLSGPI
jgi:hypothetical protein